MNSTCPHCQHITQAEAWIGEGSPNPLVIIPVSIRDWFAGMALQGWLANPTLKGSVEGYAIDAYKYADAMLTQREAP